MFWREVFEEPTSSVSHEISFPTEWLDRQQEWDFLRITKQSQNQMLPTNMMKPISRMRRMALLYAAVLASSILTKVWLCIMPVYMLLVFSDWLQGSGGPKYWKFCFKDSLQFSLQNIYPWYSLSKRRQKLLCLIIQFDQAFLIRLKLSSRDKYFKHVI